MMPLSRGLGPLGRGYGAPSSLLTGLVAYWKLDNLTDSVGANTLTNNNAVTFVPGKVGNAANFVAASSQYLSIASNAALTMGDIDFTIAGWVNLASKTTFRILMAKYLSSSSSFKDAEYVLFYDPGIDRFSFDVGNQTLVGRVNADSLGSPSINTWYFLVAQHDSAANTLTLQVNNGTIDSAAWTGGSTVNTSPMTIGCRLIGDLPHDGKMDEWGVWKRTFTTGDRTQFYNSGNGLSYPF